ncbi:alpha/beta hydrolase family protein [Paraburkholderia sp. J12]|uniref:alpha/beta hydrolase family protein n=1 Tax=Paraburkholderia sp. J12 TaxID=2805432 RepID=UPI002ABE8D08|nr:alpha/beta fold hydrolase [Paraburkholderia sp. J12]
MKRRLFLAFGSLGLTYVNGLLAAEPGARAPDLARPETAHSPRLLFPDDSQFWFETQRVFGAAEYGGALFGEVLSTASRITPGDYDSWYVEWNTVADRVSKEAAAQLARGHKVSARDSYLRASTYYRTSEFFLHGPSGDDPRIMRAYRLSVDSYKQAARLYELPIEPVEIPYEHTTLPGYFHRTAAPGLRPTLILHSGFDGSAEEMHMDGARAAVERGYNVLTFDGPGQYGPIHREGLVFRPDWDKVVTPVVDFTLKLPGVDPKRIALMGESLGGLLAPRAAAFEKRLAALIANDGLYDFAGPTRARVPAQKWPDFEKQLRAQQAPEIDAILAATAEKSPEARWAYAQGMWSLGAKTPREFVAKSLDYNLRGGIAEKISCPTLICDAESDIFFKGQPQMLYEHLTCPKTLIRFTATEGAGAHCEEGASRLAYARMFDWLDETLG